MTAKTIVIAKPFDSGLPSPENFAVIETEVPAPTEPGSIQVQLVAVSPDPYMRRLMKANINGAPTGVKPNDPVAGFVVGKVVVSNGNPDWVVGDRFGSSLPFTTIQNLSVEKLKSNYMWKLTDYLTDDNLSLGVGMLGMPGSTAYGGLTDVLRPQEGEILFVSGAAGAVGSMVGSLAKKLFNCTVIGSCGGPEKCALVKEKFGFDHAIDYKTVSNKDELKAKLKEIAPNGIDMYFENVGGFHFEAAFESLRTHGRIAVCGGISGYNEEQPTKVSINPMNMIYSFQRIEGFMCAPWLHGRKGHFLRDMNKYWKEGILIPEETVYHGVENWAEAFSALFTGKNTGKVVLYVQNREQIESL